MGLLPPLSPRNATSTPAARVFLISVLFFTLFYFYARTHFLRDPGSIFYDPTRAFDRFYTTVRTSEASSLLSHHLDLPSLRTHIDTYRTHSPPTSPCLCATVTTVNRDLSRPYVYDTLGSLLANLTLPERASLHLNVFFADLYPEHHPAFHDEQFLRLADNVHTYNSLGKSLEEQDAIAGMLNEGRMKDKAARDYATALQICQEKSTCPYVAVFEGDVIFADGWLARTYKSLREMVTDPGRLGLGERDWLDMRLFNQERSTGWVSKKVGGNHELGISMGIGAGLCLAALVLWRVRPAAQQRLTPGVLVVLCLFTVPVAVSLFYLSGKASLLPPRPGVRSEFFGCCSQALVFNRRQVSGLIDFLREQEHPLLYDMMTRNFAFANKLQRLAQYPMMAQHIGTQSAHKFNDSNLVWSMAFEGLQSHSLASAHDQYVHDIWGNDVTTRPYYDI
ncbi:hypothetical protein K461DRAFT_319840 [Myriangium duriaei CBS 260.36]|uniref:Integral membrane protein n=1 Tax=Myriangium duriaei CBS 260.36 TaxID=1168546 RepID=A0A9P4MI07_9PEZI|nr:hypothetical protein K461DRAFT_319840 [Myriangium duriaei CBS 260.36]